MCERSAPSDQPDICQNENAASRNPVTTINRGSTPRRTITPDSCIEIKVPTPRGIIAIPVPITE